MTSVLVLCTGNSCRSQMAEGYLRAFGGDDLKVYSAGVETHGVNPRAVEIMSRDGIDISMQTSNHVDEYLDRQFDYVITVCDHAREVCPVFPSEAQQLHQDFPDPAKAAGDQAQVMQAFALTRDMIKAYCQNFINKYL